MSGQVAETRREKKDARIQAIIECTFGLFSDRGIENISMNEIAAAAKIGVASLYRYFQTKEELAIEVAIYAWNIEKAVFQEVYDSEHFMALSGFEQLRELMEVFGDALVTQRSFFSFIYYFDSFIKRDKVSGEKLLEYEQTIAGANDIVIRALEKGIADGTVSFSGSGSDVLAAANVQEMLITMMHSLFCLAQKLSISGELLKMDTAVEGRKQIEILVNLILAALRKK